MLVLEAGTRASVPSPWRNLDPSYLPNAISVAAFHAAGCCAAVDHAAPSFAVAAACWIAAAVAG